MKRVIFPVASPKWARAIADAKALDEYAVKNHGQADRCFHLCAMQRQQMREGFVQVEVAKTIYGFGVRDTLNDGLGILLRSRGVSQEEAIEWARRWHAADPERREVIAGFGVEVPEAVQS
jgi:hypothetical protein